jgi:hypothetical protein
LAGQAGHAAQRFRCALAIASDLEMRPLADHCHIDLGRLQQGGGLLGTVDRHLTAGAAMSRAMGKHRGRAMLEASGQGVD